MEQLRGIELMVLHDGRRIGFEFKCADAPGMTRSLGIAREDLGLDRAFVVYPGAKRYALAERIDIVPLSEVPALVP